MFRILAFCVFLAGMVQASEEPSAVYIKNSSVAQAEVDITPPPTASSTAMQGVTNTGHTPHSQQVLSQVVIPSLAAPYMPPANEENWETKNSMPSREITDTPLSQSAQSPTIQNTTQYETSQEPLPSVSNIHDATQNKFNAKVKSCIGTNELLEEQYANAEIKQVISARFNASSSCEEILKTLQEVSTVHQKMRSLRNDAICNLQQIDPLTLTQAEANLRKDKIEKDYNSIATTYTQFFSYNEDTAYVEACMNAYSSFTITEEINKDYSLLTQEMEAWRHIVQAHGLRGFYGNNRGMSGLGLATLIGDIHAGKISVSQVSSSYAVFEPSPQSWTLSGATEDYFIYSFDGHLVGIPFTSGVSYSCDKLPHQLFIVEKKIEFPKRGYSIFMLKPLE